MQTIGVLRLHMRTHLTLDIWRLAIHRRLWGVRQQPIVQCFFRVLDGGAHGPQGVIQIKGYGLDF